ncbi:Hypothetical predicted protein [Podarcis lilfordi]|uniref:Uncharacterized protein n=1 Tax=Podarcis lilfordi TaxID=74358 RepID=A0AA35KSD1_9SAUR|nr:Hypothetical predicted protein [Podarcis lilfordi]
MIYAGRGPQNQAICNAVGQLLLHSCPFPTSMNRIHEGRAQISSLITSKFKRVMAVSKKNNPTQFMQISQGHRTSVFCLLNRHFSHPPKVTTPTEKKFFSDLHHLH